MKRLTTKAIKGSKVYFVEFDPDKTKNIKDTEKWISQTELQIKTHLLTKDSIIFGASHLNSKLAYNFFRKNISLLENEILYPALRNDVTEPSDYIDFQGHLSKVAKAFFKDTITSVVSWRLDDASLSFRDSILKAILDEKSSLNINLKYLNLLDKERIKSEIYRYEHISREDISSILIKLEIGSISSSTIKKYSNLLYYISGAKAVESESTLQRPDIIDYTFEDLMMGNTSLSEDTIFWKIFIELVFESLGVPPIQEDSLKSLSFEDIIKIRAPILSSGFCEEYDKLISLSMFKINDDPSIKFDNVSNQIIGLREKLSKTIAESLLPQRRLFEVAKIKQAKGKIYSSGVSFLVALAGLIPGVGAGASLFGVGRDGKELLNNIEQKKDSIDLEKKRERILNDIIQNCAFDDKKIFYDVVEYLCRVVAVKYQL